MVEQLIYFDNNATTRLDERVLERMIPFLQDNFANPASNHLQGLKIDNQIKIARKQVATLVNCFPEEIVFTSGATESVNLAMKGFALSNQSKGRHIVTANTEHQAVLDSCKYLENIGFEVTYLNVNQYGIIDIRELKEAIRPDTILGCFMLINNETGARQPIEEISEIIHSNGAILFCDATQAVGKTPIDLDAIEIDMLALSGHKFYGPKGVGALYVCKSKGIKLIPLMHGGGHEHSLRSGTLNVPGIMGLGEACKIALNEMNSNRLLIEQLVNKLEVGLLKIPGSFINGNRFNKLYNVTNICFPGTDGQTLIGQLENIAVSNGSACNSATLEPSHVLLAMGLTQAQASSSIRFSVGKYNTEPETENVIMKITELIGLALSD